MKAVEACRSGQHHQGGCQIAGQHMMHDDVTLCGAFDQIKPFQKRAARNRICLAQGRVNGCRMVIHHTALAPKIRATKDIAKCRKRKRYVRFQLSSFAS